MSRLPPFLALRALESAARHRSYSRAAAELNVTHGAVSPQIRRLEAEFGLRLFHRQGNAMAPTPVAAALASRVSEALAVLERGVDELRSDADCGPLVLTVVSHFATRWLARRLARLTDDLGGERLTLRVEDRMVDFFSERVDVGLRHGSGDWPGLEATPLLMDSLFPVCSPEFLARYPLREPADLLKAPLLRQNGRPWSLWMRCVGVEAPPAQGGLIFEDSALLVDAALHGVGVALARSGLVEEDLRTGRLVRPFPESVDARAGYFVVWRGDNPKLPRILKLRDWLVAEAQIPRAAA